MERFNVLRAAFARDVLKQARRIAAMSETDFADIHIVSLADLATKLQAVETELDLAGRFPPEVVLDPYRLRRLSDALDSLARGYEAEIAGGSKEQWEAAINLKDASRLLFSAAAWLGKHQRKEQHSG
jgi:hypothetical protein